MIDENKHLKIVREQYENYPFPERDPQDEKKRLLGTTTCALESINHYGFKGKHDFHKARMLVAGGGTGDALIYLAEQLRETDAEVVYLDMSQRSMEVAQARAQVRGLDNIQWLHHSLLELPDLDIGQFDYINCSGVLHHLADPDEGLLALKSVLKKPGLMGIMLYGTIGRTGIYQMQHLLQMANHNEPDMRVQIENTRMIMNELPRTNWYKRAEEMTTSLERDGDIGLYDTFLHPQDRAYTVPQMYEYVEKAGLHFVEYAGGEKILYRPDFYIKNPVLLARLQTMTKREQEAFTEYFVGNRIKHTFYLSNETSTIADVHDLENTPFFHRYPINGKQIHDAILSRPGQSLTLTRPDKFMVTITPDKHTHLLFKYLDGSTSLGSIFEKIKNEIPDTVPQEQLMTEFLKFYQAFHAADWMLLRHKSIGPTRSYEQMQAFPR